MSTQARASTPTLAVVIAAGIDVASCVPAAREVTSTFVASASCPADRVTVTQLDTRPETGTPGPEPPPEIAADPERAAIYRQTHPGKWVDAHRTFAAEGCGQREVYVCDVIVTRYFKVGRDGGGRYVGPGCVRLSEYRDR